LRAISLDTIRDASRNIYDVVVRTPLVALGQLSPGGPEIYLKLETLQPIGSFKIRGAYNAVRRLPPDRIANGVWTVSAGNAAQGWRWPHARRVCRAASWLWTPPPMPS